MREEKEKQNQKAVPLAPVTKGLRPPVFFVELMVKSSPGSYVFFARRIRRCAGKPCAVAPSNKKAGREDSTCRPDPEQDR